MATKTRSIKTQLITYWTTTAILSLDFALGGVTSILRPPQVIEGMQHLGYPAYLATQASAATVAA
jgi:hypothetical protein